MAHLSNTVDLWFKPSPLLQHDLFQCILDCLAPPEMPIWDKQAKEARSAIFTLAQTCRALSEPALDRLWRRLNSLKPLIRCFATIVDEERAKIPPSLAEWAIVFRHSNRIRELYIADHISLCFLQSTHLNPSLLVPNLRSLTWDIDWSRELRSSISFIQKLLSPSLISLQVSLFDVNNVFAQSFLASYHLLCPNLKAIAIHFLDHAWIPPPAVASFSEAIFTYKHLECLDASVPVNSVALLHIAKFPTLKKLTLVHHPDLPDSHQLPLLPDIVPFCNVLELSLSIHDLTFFTTFLRSQDQGFRSLRLQLGSQPSIDAVSTFFAALSSPQRVHTLQLFILVLAEDLRCLSESVIYSGTLQPLACFCHLRDLEIGLGHPVSISDDELTSLALNWPSLRVLNMSWQSTSEHPWESFKYVTLHGLLSLGACCPDLVDLMLPLDARRVPVTADMDTEGTENIEDAEDTINTDWHPLSSLVFPNSPIDDSRLVGKFFLRHFPCISELCSMFDIPSTADGRRYGLLWKQVATYIKDRKFMDYDSDLDFGS